uniref:NIDO domain-containing protein n=1 Tax=Ciona savignyi TaxID=51511 RepID=H2Y5S7_CIOSA
MSIKVLLQVEWNDVLIFPDYSFPNQGSTFQCILASDGIETIVFFVYQGGLMKFLPNTMIRSQNNVQIGFFNNLGLFHHSEGNYQPYLSSNTGTLGLYMYQFSATSNNIAKCLAWYNEERLLPPLIPRLNCPWSSAAAGRDTRWIRKETIYSWWNIDPQTAVPP